MDSCAIHVLVQVRSFGPPLPRSARHSYGAQPDGHRDHQCAARNMRRARRLLCLPALLREHRPRLHSSTHTHRTGTRDTADGTRRTHTHTHVITRARARTQTRHHRSKSRAAHTSHAPHARASRSLARPPRRGARRARAASASSVGRELAVRAHGPRWPRYAERVRPGTRRCVPGAAAA